MEREPTREEITNTHIQGLYDDVARLKKAVETMAWWLVQAQTGFGVQDARGIEDILKAAREKP
jgi:hypothetical protein